MPQKGGASRLHDSSVENDYKLQHIGIVHGDNAMGCGAEIQKIQKTKKIT